VNNANFALYSCAHGLQQSIEQLCTVQYRTVQQCTIQQWTATVL